MKKLSRLFVILVFISLASCHHDDDTVTPVDTTPDYQKAINAKLIMMGWDKDGHALFNGTGPVKTSGGTGYVQYYAFGARKTAIYYYPSKGASAMDTAEMNSYDASGQDKWALVTSDPKSCGSGCGYNEIMTTADNMEGIIIFGISVPGEFYKKYKALKLWDGPLGLPVTSVLDTPNKSVDKGTFVTFKNGTIWNTPTIGTQALWGKVLSLWSSVDYERSWLGYPMESCDPNKGNAFQKVAFQNGSIGVGDTGTCGNFYDKSGLSVLKTGKTASGIPCY